MRIDIKEVVFVKKRNKEKIKYAPIARQYDCDYRQRLQLITLRV